MTGRKQNHSNTRAVLVLGNYRATLVVIRSLASAGYTVILGVQGKRHGNDRSRFVDELWSHPPFDAKDGAFDAALAAFVERRGDIDAIFPVTEEAVVHFTRRADDRPAGLVLASVDSSVVDTCQSKERSMALALEAKVPFARYAAVENLAELSSAAADIGFPCVLRPLVAPSRLLGKKALILSSADELRRAMPEWPDEHKRLLVQRYLKAPRQNLYFVARDGKLVSCVQVTILRTDRADGTGLAVEGNTVPLDERLRGYSAALIERLGYSGVGCVQFLVDPESNEVSFLEINPRLGANCAIVQSCGIDLPHCALAIAAGESLDRCDVPEAYPPGRRYAWLFGDLAGLQHELAGRRVGLAGAGRWLIRAVASSLRADVHLTFSWRDPMPTLTLFARRAGRLLHRLRSHRERAITPNGNERIGQRADADGRF